MTFGHHEGRRDEGSAVQKARSDDRVLPGAAVANHANSVLLEAVSELARHAGDVALRYFKRELAVSSKSDGSPVTDADRACEQAARDWIVRRFPGDGIVGEEFGEVNPDAPRRWIIDPIDGTKTFIRGVPLWGTLIAVASGPDILGGAAYFPAVGELIAASPGLGCWWNGSRSRVSDTSDLSLATVLTTDAQFSVAPERGAAWARLAARAGVSRTWGDCYGYLLVATGRAEVMVDPVLALWDAAPLLPIIVEAGGVFTDWRGQPTVLGGSAIATNLALAGEARAVLGDEIVEEPGPHDE